MTIFETASGDILAVNREGLIMLANHAATKRYSDLLPGNLSFACEMGRAFTIAIPQF